MKASVTNRAPRRRWGQNFLIDPNIVRKILDCADVHPGERVIEIGPGRGILTRALLDRGACVTAIEIDRDLSGGLEQSLVRFLESTRSTARGTASRLSVIRGDALRYPFDRVPGPYQVVSNLPYNTSTAILFRLLEARRQISRMVLMLQREVAERMVAEVAEKSYGALSVILQYYADIKIAFSVSPACFRPRPKVASAVLCLHPLTSPRVSVKDERLFLRIIKAAFQYRRKQLSNALSIAGFPREALQNALEVLQHDPGRRGETYSMAEFAALSDALLRYQL